MGLTSSYKDMLDKEFNKKDFEIEYQRYLWYLKNVYWISNIHSRISPQYKILDSSYNIKYFPHLDYIIELKSNEMPINYILKDKGKENVIPNINHTDRYGEIHNTVFERITMTELLGFFTIVSDDLISELENNKFTKYSYQVEKTIDGNTVLQKKTIKLNTLKNKRVIFICPENIQKTYANLLALNDKNLKCLLNYQKLLQFVFFHEYGHCAFYDINIENGNKNIRIHEKQANYYASIVLEGKYDYLIEIINNRIGKEYKNPLLKSHEYTKGMNKFKKEESKLYE